MSPVIIVAAFSQLQQRAKNKIFLRTDLAPLCYISSPITQANTHSRTQRQEVKGETFRINSPLSLLHRARPFGQSGPWQFTWSLLSHYLQCPCTLSSLTHQQCLDYFPANLSKGFITVYILLWDGEGVETASTWSHGNCKLHIDSSRG